MTREAFIKYRVRESIDFAAVSVAAVCVLKEGRCFSARIVLGAVAPGPYRAKPAEDLMVGNPIDPETATAPAEVAVSGAVPLRRNAYKIEIARALVKRALLAYASQEA